jgi:hypothetical protein
MLLVVLLAASPSPITASQQVPLDGSAGASGYVVNAAGEGLGSVPVTGRDIDGRIFGTASCPSSAMRPTVSPGTCMNTGFWVITGLPPSTSVTFMVGGTNVVAQNVRPNQSITRTTGPSGTWIDVGWIVLQAFGTGGLIPIFQGGAFIEGTVTDARGTPITGPGAFAVLFSLSQNQTVASTIFADATPAIVDLPSPSIQGENDGASVKHIVAVAPLDVRGHYCFGAPIPRSDCHWGHPGATPMSGRFLPPGGYLVTVVDDRPTDPCPGLIAGQAQFGTCGGFPWTSYPVTAEADQVTTVDVTLPPRTAPTAVGGPNNVVARQPSDATIAPSSVQTARRCAMLVTAPSRGTWEAGADFVFTPR